MQIFTIKDSVQQAYQNSSNKELKAIIYLSINKKNKLSKKYRKSAKKLSKVQKKVKKLQKTGRDEYNSKILEKDKSLITNAKIQKDCIEEAKGLEEIENVLLISRRIMQRYKQGLMISDLARGMKGSRSSYGRLIYNLLSKISSDSIIKKIKRIRRKEKSFFQKLKDEKPEVKEKSYKDSEEGAMYLEFQLMLFFIDKITSDYTPEQKTEMIEEMISAVAEGNVTKKNKLFDMYKKGKLGYDFSKIVLNIIQSFGKGPFMNGAVKVTNVLLRLIGSKAMTYGQNAVFRQALAKLLGETKEILTLIIAIIMTLADIFNQRDYQGLLNTIFGLYLLRNHPDSEK